MDKKKILVVEDEKAISDILVFNLQREGYNTLAAYDGAEGLRCALEEAPDLILLDVMLPEMDGFEVCRRVRAEKDTPIIMLTAREEETDKVMGLELGADDYITKPFSMRELMARVKANMRRTYAGEDREKAEAPSGGGLRRRAGVRRGMPRWPWRYWQGQTACWTIAIWRVRPRRRNRPAGPSITAGFRRRKR